MTDQVPVLLERLGHVALITLNRPEQRNGMTPDLLDAFANTIQLVAKQTDLRCVVITGRGPSFCAGADFRADIQRPDDGAGRVSAERSYAMYKPFLSILDIEVPVIAALQGHAVGGGFGLALAADVRIANQDSKYGANFARIGLAPGMAITYLLPRLIGVPRSTELLLTGRLFSGREGAEMALFSKALPGDQVLQASLDLAQQIAANAPITVRLTKKLIYQNLQWNPRDAAWLESFAQAATLQTEDVSEGTRALLEKRLPQFQGC